VIRLRAEFAQQLISVTEGEEGINRQRDDMRRLEQKVAEQEKALREAQHELDAHESMSTLYKEQAEQEQLAMAAAIAREAAAISSMDELESELACQRNAMRDAVSWAKANTKQRLKSAESKRKDLQLQLDEHREAESQLAQQEDELRTLLELVKSQGEQEVQVFEAKNMDLQAELSEQKKRLQACEANGAELDDLLKKQREMTAVECNAMESVSEVAAMLAKQRDDLKDDYETRIKKLKARIKELEMMLEISKEFLKGDTNGTGTVDTDDEASVFNASLGNQTLRPTSVPKMNKVGMRNSHSAGSLRNRLHSPGRMHSYVVKDVGFSWPGRHLGPDQEGPLKVKYEESEDEK